MNDGDPPVPPAPAPLSPFLESELAELEAAIGDENEGFEDEGGTPSKKERVL